jgi:acetyl/propionyl-CoA carboxylase alpha subunit
MGDKRAARSIAERVGAPVVPGAEGDDPGALARAAAKTGYPMLLKAALGGGGKGMRVVHDEAELREAFEGTRRVALSGFGDASVYVEKRIERARHIEVQIAGDGQGRVTHLLERECTLQRRHQKVVEESPASNLDPALRQRILRAAVDVAREVRYRGVGTVEFLVARDQFLLLEMNTRLQVEHPVTELVTGIDLVRLQLEIAAEGRLPLGKEEVVPRGHAIEARVYAEDAGGSVPSSGRNGEPRALAARRVPARRCGNRVGRRGACPLRPDPCQDRRISLPIVRSRSRGWRALWMTRWSTAS